MIYYPKICCSAFELKRQITNSTISRFTFECIDGTFSVEVVDMTLEEFGPFLVEQRKKHDLTQAQLAEKLDVSTAAISKWERGRCLPEVTKFNDIAKAFDLSLMEVMQCKENGAKTEEVDNVINDSINLTKNQYRRRERKWILACAIILAIGLCIHFFPVYHILQVWSPSYFTTGDVTKLLYIGSSEERDTARLFIAKANEAFSDLNTPSDQLEEKYGLFKRYATSLELGGSTEKHLLKLWTADFDSFDGYGYIWAYYSNSVFDAEGEEIRGSRNIPSLWVFEKDDAGTWQLIHIKEHP